MTANRAPQRVGVPRHQIYFLGGPTVAVMCRPSGVVHRHHPALYQKPVALTPGSGSLDVTTVGGLFLVPAKEVLTC